MINFEKPLIPPVAERPQKSPEQELTQRRALDAVSLVRDGFRQRSEVLKEREDKEGSDKFYKEWSERGDKLIKEFLDAEVTNPNKYIQQLKALSELDLTRLIGFLAEKVGQRPSATKTREILGMLNKRVEEVKASFAVVKTPENLSRLMKIKEQLSQNSLEQPLQIVAIKEALYEQKIAEK